MELTFKDKVLGFKGRMKRMSFFLWYIANFFVFTGIFVAYFLSIGAMGMIGRSGGANEAAAMESLMGIGMSAIFILIPLLILNLYVTCALAAKRFHDMGYGGLWVILLFVPYLAFIVLIVMFFFPSEKIDNKFGPSNGGKYEEGFIFGQNFNKEEKINTIDTPAQNQTTETY